MTPDEKRMEERLIEDEGVKFMARKIFREKGYEAMKAFTYNFIYGVTVFGRPK